MITLTLTKDQARILVEALNEAVDACTHEIAMGRNGEYDWEADRAQYMELEDAVDAQVAAQGGIAS